MPVLSLTGNIISRGELAKPKAKKRRLKYKSVKRIRYLYCLRLEDGKYYIGQTINLENRIRQHEQGKGSSWTKLHRYIEVVQTEKLGKMTEKDALKFEDDMTIKYAMMYGVENVRGGSFCGTSSIYLRRAME